jgi:nitroreductase
MEQFAQNEQWNLIRTDWSPRVFSTRMIEPEKLRCLLERTGQTPSYLNEQPWSFIIATKDDADEYERLFGCIAEVNAGWARRAPVLMLSIARLNYGPDGGRNKHAFRDVRHAISNLVILAKGFGIVAHQIAGFDEAKARSQFQIPRGYASTAVIALGYPGDLTGSTGDAQERETSAHRPLESFVFTRSWGQASPLLRDNSRESSRFKLGC